MYFCMWIVDSLLMLVLAPPSTKLDDLSLTYLCHFQTDTQARLCMVTTTNDYNLTNNCNDSKPLEK